MKRPHNLRASSACRANMFRMGHCAPTVMQTLLEELERPTEQMVRAVGGLPGIGGQGECGGVLSPLMVLALLDSPRSEMAGVPLSIRRGQEYLRRFRELHGSVLCKDIGTECMRCCYNAVVLSPPLFDEIVGGRKDAAASIDDSTASVYAKLSVAMERAQFHCANSVLDGLCDSVTVTEEMRAAATICVGGIALSGSTCGALVAGAMAMSAKISGIERSRWRTLKMIVTMVFSAKRALGDSMNAFNPALRTTTSLVRWFGEEFGSTRCADLARMDPSSSGSVDRFCASDGLEACKERARRVVANVREMLASEEQPTPEELAQRVHGAERSTSMP